jgi:CCR4-NOT transcription complex subunit 6
MADGPFRFHSGTGQPTYYQQFNQRSHLQHQQRPGSPASSGRIGGFNTDTPSPSRSPGPQSPAHQYGMYNHTNSHNPQGLMNGASHRYNIQMNLNKPFNHHAHQPHASQQQHHGEHTGQHTTNYVSHQHNQSGGGGLNNAASHFTPSSHMQNGTHGTPNFSTPKPVSEHWTKQQERARLTREMTTTHPHARNASTASKNVVPSANNALTRENEKEERYRAAGWPVEESEEQQTWSELDLGGSNLRIIAQPLFRYTFLTKLHVNNNKLQYVPQEIGKLRNLVHLDLSLNELSELPPQMGMLTKLKELLVFDNHLVTLPFELGNLYNLELLGIEGNPLNEEFKSIVMDEDSGSLIRYLRENAPGMLAMCVI